MCASNCIATVWTELISILTWQCLCIRQGSKRNNDSVSVEELDWSAESQVLIPAELLWCDFKYRPWAKRSSPNTNFCIFLINFHWRSFLTMNNTSETIFLLLFSFFESSPQLLFFLWSHSDCHKSHQVSYHSDEVELFKNDRTAPVWMDLYHCSVVVSTHY